MIMGERRKWNEMFEENRTHNLAVKRDWSCCVYSRRTFWDWAVDAVVSFFHSHTETLLTTGHILQIPTSTSFWWPVKCDTDALRETEMAFRSKATVERRQSSRKSIHWDRVTGMLRLMEYSQILDFCSVKLITWSRVWQWMSPNSSNSVAWQDLKGAALALIMYGLFVWSGDNESTP